MSVKQLISERNSALYAVEAAVKEIRSTRAALIHSECEKKALTQNVRDLEDLYAEKLDDFDAKDREIERAHAINKEMQVKQRHLMEILSYYLLERGDEDRPQPPVHDCLPRREKCKGQQTGSKETSTFSKMLKRRTR